MTDINTQLRRDEGVRRFAYKDTVGKITIGVGRNLTDVGLSDIEIDMLLNNDIAHVTQQLAISYPWTAAMDEIRRAVLINMAFNLGINGLSKFNTFLSKVQVSDWDGASNDMLNTQWARQVGLRANRLARQLVTGTWQ